MAKKPFRHPNKTHFDYDNGNSSVFERSSLSNRYDERRRSNTNISYYDSLHGMSRASSTESLLDDLSMRATSVFQSLDPLERGYIKPEDLFSLNSDLEEDELMDVFNQLDLDNDGCINLEDFKAGLRLIGKTICKKNMERRRSRVSSLSGWSPNHEQEHRSTMASCRGKLASIGSSLDEGISVFSCGERMSDFYESIGLTNPEMAEQFNDLVDLMVNDVKELIMDKHFLNASFQKEKAAFENKIRHLEEEYESQISQICENETRLEAEKIEKEFRQLMQKKQEEIQSLKETLAAAEEKSKNVTTTTSHTSMELKEELTKLQKENNNLQVQLSASQTECAVIRSEQVTVKQQFHEKITQLQHEKNNLHMYENDWQNLTKQLQMLRDINRKLQDTNDSLRSAVEASPSSEIIRKFSSHSAPNKNFSALNNNLLLCDPAYYKVQKSKGFERRESVTHDSIIDEHADSGLSTLRDVAELESEIQPMNAFIEIYERPSKSTLNENCNECQTHSTNSIEHTMVSLQKDTKKETLSVEYGTRRKQRSKERRRQQYSRDRDIQPKGDASDSEYPADNYYIDNKDVIPQAVAKNIRTVMPERVFKIVFAGDASVGKSTFIMRLCTDSFVSDCQTTIGIDFRNKTVEVDDKQIGLQLWDTAGQERFRSMTANYFRKADGVILLYDCTFQESFIHVRDWIESIRSAAGDDIPIVLVANKSDLAGRFEQEGKRVVKKEEGDHLAKENKLIFTEASAKSGHNIQTTVEELARLLAKNEDLQSSKNEVNLKSTSIPTSSKASSQCCK